MTGEPTHTSNVYAPWEELRLMFIEMNKYNVPCPYKRALETNAVQALRDCEDEFDPFTGGANFTAKATENVGLSSREYFLATINSWCQPSGAGEKEQPSVIDDFFQAIHVNTEEKVPNSVSIFH